MNLQNIRDFHNSVKNDIINDVYTHIPYTLNTNEASILDLACGRGGDMHKIYYTNFKRVLFVDNHSVSLDIARKRFNDSYKNKKFHAQFVLHDLKESLLLLSNPVDVVIMNFALNYFFDSEKSLKTLLETVSRSLKENGYFVGIALDSDRVKNAPIKTDLYTIDPLPSFHTNETYDRGYKISFNDPEDDYFAFRGSMIEYLIDIDELKRVAKMFHLEFVSVSYISSDEPLLRMDFIFKFILKTNNHRFQNSRLYFPSAFHHLNLQTRPETPIVCSRPEASVVIMNIIHSLCDNVSLLIDATAHVGCDTLSLALLFKDTKFIAIEKDTENFTVLERNVSMCELNNITVVHDDFVRFLQNTELTIDVLYIDAPWGGTSYKKNTTVSLFINDIELSVILRQCCDNSRVIILKVPVNFDLEVFQQNMNNKTIQRFPYNYKNSVKFYFLSVS